MWDADHDFLDWLDREGYGTDENPISDEVLDLMYEAWKAGQENAAGE